MANATKTTQSAAPDGRHRGPRSDFVRRLLALALKLAIIAAVLILLLGYVFGLSRNLSQNMQPALQDGDLLFYYRIIRHYAAGDVVVLRYQDRDLTERVVAVAGDTVDITAKGLVINGSVVQEPQVIGETTQFEGGAAFPLTVPRGQVFLLGDNRPHATDSRLFGCVPTDDISGRLIGLFRRRNF
jgi:signal peptidase I